MFMYVHVYLSPRRQLSKVKQRSTKDLKVQKPSVVLTQTLIPRPNPNSHTPFLSSKGIYNVFTITVLRQAM